MLPATLWAELFGLWRPFDFLVTPIHFFIFPLQLISHSCLLSLLLPGLRTVSYFFSRQFISSFCCQTRHTSPPTHHIQHQHCHQHITDTITASSTSPTNAIIIATSSSYAHHIKQYFTGETLETGGW